MISSYLQFIERRYKNTLDTDADKFIAYALEGANRLKEQVFTAFKRLYRREYPGVGLGLSIGKKVIMRHGGQIQIESDRERVQRSILPYLYTGIS